MFDWGSVLSRVAMYLGALACIATGILIWRSWGITGIRVGAGLLTIGIVWLLILLWSDDDGKYNF